MKGKWDMKGRKDVCTISTIPPQSSLRSHDLPLLKDDAGLCLLLVSGILSPGQISRHQGGRQGKDAQGIKQSILPGTLTLAILRITVAVLITCKNREEAVEAWQAFSFKQGMIGSASMCGGVEWEGKGEVGERRRRKAGNILTEIYSSEVIWTLFTFVGR
jgi:hypothetical protein